MRPKNKITSRSGFTVMEMVVASALLMMVAGLLLSIFSRVSDFWLVGESTIERQRNYRLGFDVINRYLSPAMVTTNNNPNGNLKFYGTSTSCYFVSPIDGNSNYVSDIAKFGFEYSSGKVTFKSTFPTDTATVANNIRATTLAGFQGGFTTTSDLIENVYHFNVKYYNSAGTLVTTWDSTAAGAQFGKIPSVVEIEVLLLDSRSAVNIPSGEPARTDYINRRAITNNMVIHLIQSS